MASVRQPSRFINYGMHNYCATCNIKFPKKFSYVMIARKELGLDHLSDPDTQNLREFEFGLYRF